MNFQIRELNRQEIINSLELVKRVFMEFEAPDYTDEGIAEFKSYITPQRITERIQTQVGVLLQTGN